MNIKKHATTYDQTNICLSLPMFDANGPYILNVHLSITLPWKKISLTCLTQITLISPLLFQVSFEDVLAEPDGAHSIDCVWKLSYTCFNLWLNICYKLSTLCCGICIAAEWGCEFANIAFIHVWHLTPCLKIFEINCNVLKRLYANIVGCCMEPCCESCGRIFKSFEK